MTLLERFNAGWIKLKMGCWIWIGAKRNQSGYGQICIKNKKLLAHRVAYELYIGPIPYGLQIDHLCRVRCCVNPDHLEPVTLRENIRRGDTGINSRIKTHCPQSHPYDEVNTHIYMNGKGIALRVCRTCKRLKQAQHRQNRKLARTG